MHAQIGGHDDRVAFERLATGAKERGAAKSLLQTAVGCPQQKLQIIDGFLPVRLRYCLVVYLVVYLVVCSPGGSGVRFGLGHGVFAVDFSVPRANRLANVAAKKPVADFIAQINGSDRARFNRKIRDALSRIKLARFDERASGAGIHASGAGTTVIGTRDFRYWQVECGVNLGDEKKRTFFTIDQTGIFTDPAEPRAHGQIPFKNGTGVRKGDKFLLRRESFKLGDHPRQALLQQKMIIETLSIGCDLNGTCEWPIFDWSRVWNIIQRYDNCRPGRLEKAFGITLVFKMALEIFHLAIEAFLQPINVHSDGYWSFELCDSEMSEALGGQQRFNLGAFQNWGQS